MRALAVLILLAFTSNVAIAAAPSPESYRKEEGQIPSTPTMPPALSRPATPETFQCERTFIYKGKALTCDSNVQQDGEKLRPVIADTPAAIDELNTYQRNRRNLKNFAYFATIGLAVTIAGIIMNHPPIDQNTGEIKPGFFLVAGGLAMTAGSIIYGFSLSRTNESHLNGAVQEFNKTHPNQPIELQFSTGIKF